MVQLINAVMRTEHAAVPVQTLAIPRLVYEEEPARKPRAFSSGIAARSQWPSVPLNGCKWLNRARFANVEACPSSREAYHRRSQPLRSQLRPLHCPNYTRRL